MLAEPSNGDNKDAWIDNIHKFSVLESNPNCLNYGVIEKTRIIEKHSMSSVYSSTLWNFLNFVRPGDLSTFRLAS